MQHVAEQGPADSAAAMTEQALEIDRFTWEMRQAEHQPVRASHSAPLAPLPMDDVSASQSSGPSSESEWEKVDPIQTYSHGRLQDHIAYID